MTEKLPPRNASIASSGRDPTVGQAFLPARADRNVCATFEAYVLLNHFEAVGGGLEHDPLRAGLQIGKASPGNLP